MENIYCSVDAVQPTTLEVFQGKSLAFGMSLYGYTAATNLLLQLTNGNDRAVGRMGNISTLLIPNNLPVRMLNSFISNSSYLIGSFNKGRRRMDRIGVFPSNSRSLIDV